MSRHDYEIGCELKLKDASFYGIIMGAMMRADTPNARRLRSLWPDVWDEVQARYDAPGARLPTDSDFRSEEDFIVFFPERSLSVDDIWPDKDAPEEPTAQDVVEQMRKCGSATSVIKEWNLLDSLEVIGPHDKETYR